VHIYHDQGIYCHLLLFGERLTNQLNQVIKLLGGNVEVASNVVFGDSFLDEGSPPDLRAVEDALSGMVAGPLGPFGFRVFVDGVFELVLDALAHHAFHLVHPIFHVLVVGVDFLHEVNLLLLGRIHGYNGLLVIELDRINVLEDLFEVGLHCCGLFCLG